MYKKVRDKTIRWLALSLLSLMIVIVAHIWILGSSWLEGLDNIYAYAMGLVVMGAGGMLAFPINTALCDYQAANKAYKKHQPVKVGDKGVI